MNPVLKSVSLLGRLKAARPDDSDWRRLQEIDLLRSADGWRGCPDSVMTPMTRPGIARILER
jgi:hypothetical protein